MSRRNDPRREFDREIILPWLGIFLIIAMALADHFLDIF